MNHIHDLYSWSDQRREEAIRVTRRWPSKGGQRQALRTGSALSGVLSLLR
jgi:hypothetical protein